MQVDQKELESLIERYNSTDPAVVKENIVKYIDTSPYSNQGVANLVGVDIQTIYSWRQIRKQTGISFENAVKLCNVLGISLVKLMEN